MAFPIFALIAQAVLSKSHNEGAQKLGSAFGLLQGMSKPKAKTMPFDSQTYH